MQFRVGADVKVLQHMQPLACACSIPVLSNRMTMLFHARLWSGFSMVAFLQAFRASTCLFWSAYYCNKRPKESLCAEQKLITAAAMLSKGGFPCGPMSFIQWESSHKIKGDSQSMDIPELGSIHSREIEAMGYS